MSLLTPAGGPLLNDGEKETSSPSFLPMIREIANEARGTYKASGFKGLLARYGWKMVGLIVVYYLVRDTLLYLVLPYLIARNFF